ncbi:PREDICTED: GDSL esterase/lipase At1g29660-like [Populus euphratica]|uniref:GDSL esterase/lipase At1g29660-like n=1 Tax=Populus euphratica TaxID=75702 RepID=A0AAJ6TPK7_POPEU|nr:PREDICTED: GDSL esterase/lipase At1g29660-like [Populus euphratica]
MESGLKALWVLSVVLLVSNWQHWTYGKRVPQVPCYFVFGDSLFDNGNNNYLNLSAKVNYLPYGIDFDTGASGRCSNGLNIADTVAEQLGFDSYISDFGVGGCTNFLDGVNYASNGAGILDSTGSLAGELFTMNAQLFNHNITVSRIAKILGSEEVARKYLSQCIYVSDMGHNDYLNNYFLDGYNSSKKYTPEKFAQLLIETYETQLEKLYFSGARKIAVFGLIRVGCMPHNIQKHPSDVDGSSSCVDKLNSDVQFFNDKLPTLLQKLNIKHTDAAFTYINSYEIDSDHQTNTGFTQTRNSCCEVEPGSVPCKSLSFPCSNRSDYVYWDGAHFTEAKAWAFGKRAYKSLSQQDASPYDISGLAKLKLDDSDAYDINHAQL